MTTAVYQLDNEHFDFPPPEHALMHPNGLLAIGGDLSPQRLKNAYFEGIFPWYNPGEPILWWSPNPRAILNFNDFHISRSLKKSLRRSQFTYTINQAFNQVITKCAATRSYSEGTWITSDILKGYNQLHHNRQAHSIEVWQNDELVGGLYGVSVGAVFCGESMFHTVTDASKAAMVVLVDLLSQFNYAFIDCQLQNSHLSSLGISEIDRETFLAELYINRKTTIPKNCWDPRPYKLSHPK
ncbi:leucyl/phenylalanyl-tRNA--protein transferase [Algibacillus agarilyticus]|uniref:leucyl/phenylalanyl-tRNA--protein transferase n=1 Tax=Algibacillus agarilyticus TaxID=2234133 RepID=UPI000DCF9886|nr:leucyl/phenylalanyl-tRNA--protein transferase [Algibacillus agarilyticus]